MPGTSRSEFKVVERNKLSLRYLSDSDPPVFPLPSARPLIRYINLEGQLKFAFPNEAS